LDNASYFTAKAVQELVKETPIELCYLPRGSPELNPAEECWKKLNQALGNRLFDTPDDLRDAALAALDSINPPNLFYPSMSVSIRNGPLEGVSLRADLEHSLKEAVYNLFSWVRDHRNRDIDDLMQQIDHLFVNVRG
jgi:transposase InsO family protein